MSYSFVTPWTVALQAPLSMGFSRQEYQSKLPCLPPGDLPIQGSEPSSLTPPTFPCEIFTIGITWEACLPCILPKIFPLPISLFKKKIQKISCTSRARRSLALHHNSLRQETISKTFQLDYFNLFIYWRFKKILYNVIFTLIFSIKKEFIMVGEMQEVI